MSDEIVFEEASIPEGLGEMPESSDPMCEVCGTPLYYGGRGRKPKFCAEHKPSRGTSKGGSRGRNGAAVDAAMANLALFNDLLGFPIGLLSVPANQVWQGKKPTLLEQARPILESDPALAKRIAGVGSISGKWLLLAAYGMALKDVAIIAAADVSQQRAQKRAEAEAEAEAARLHVVE